MQVLASTKLMVRGAPHFEFTSSAYGYRCTKGLLQHVLGLECVVKLEEFGVGGGGVFS